jgi:hypothetical protein
MVVGDVDEPDEGHPRFRGQFAIGADPPDMRAVAQTEHAGACLLGARHRGPDRFGRHALAEAAPGVAYQQCTVIDDRAKLLVRNQQPIFEQANIGREHPDPMTVMAAEIGAHEVVGDFLGLLVAAAHAGRDQFRKSLQSLRLELRHRAVSSSHPFPGSSALNLRRALPT